MSAGEGRTLPCCNYLEDEDRPCLGVMVRGELESVCGYCGGRCGVLAHVQCVDDWNPHAPADNPCEVTR